MIVKRITITPDLQVMVRMATNNIRPLDFRYDEVAFLTETLLTDGIDKYEAWERCREDKEYERSLLLSMRNFLHYRPVLCRCHLEHRGRPVRRISVGRISFSQQHRKYPFNHTLWIIFEDFTFAFRSGEKPRSRKIYGQ